MSKHPNYFICDCDHMWDEVLADNKRKAVCPECGLKHYPIPSVTTIINNQLGWNNHTLRNWYAKMFRDGKDPENVRDTAADTGTLCHEYIESYSQKREINKDMLTTASMDDIIIAEAGLEHFKTIMQEHNYIITQSEEIVFSKEHRFGGRIDCGINDYILGDVKTSSYVYPSHIIQLAAYDRALREMGKMQAKEWVIFHVSKDIEKPEDEIVTVHEISKEMIDEGWEIFKTLLWLNDKQKTFKLKPKKKSKD